METSSECVATLGHQNRVLAYLSGALLNTPGPTVRNRIRRSNYQATVSTRAASAGPTKCGIYHEGATLGFVCPGVDGRAVASERDLYSPGAGSAVRTDEFLCKRAPLWPSCLAVSRVVESMGRDTDGGERIAKCSPRELTSTPVSSRAWLSCHVHTVSFRAVGVVLTTRYFISRPPTRIAESPITPFREPRPLRSPCQLTPFPSGMFGAYGLNPAHIKFVVKFKL